MTSAAQATSEARNVGVRPQQQKKSEGAPGVVQAIRGPTHEQIARRAYELFLARGSVDGHAQEDWAQAERELRLGRY